MNCKGNYTSSARGASGKIASYYDCHAVELRLSRLQHGVEGSLRTVVIVSMKYGAHSMLWIAKNWAATVSTPFALRVPLASDFDVGPGLGN